MINTIDAVTMLPRTVEAADLQGRENHLIQNAAQHPGEQFQQKVEQDQRQTVESQKTETGGSDAQGGSGKGDEHHARDKKKKQEKEAPVAPRSNSSFDIMI